MNSENIPENLQALEAKICRMRGVENNNKSLSTSEYVSAAGVGVQIAADLLAGVLVGAGVGYVLDMILGVRPIMLAVFLLFGGAAGFLNVYRTVKNEEKKGK